MERNVETRTVHVLTVNPTPLEPTRKKALLAMQAVALFTSEDEYFYEKNSALQVVANQIEQPATLTYEDLIFTNPLDDTAYVMSQEPRLAADEAYFYAAHRSIEEYLGYAVVTLIPGIEKPKEVDVPTVADAIKSATKDVVDMHRVLSADAFAAMRTFFIGLNGFPGPSGFFTQTMPLLDLLIHGGSNIAASERTAMLHNNSQGLYPKNIQRISGGDILQELLAQDDPSLQLSDDDRQRLVLLLNKFRNAHRGNVKKFIPESITRGTAGVESLGTYLASKLILSKGAVAR